MAETMQNKMLGLLARFDNPSKLIEAARKVRDSGYKKFDCHSPFPIHGMDQAMGLKRSPLGWMVGLAALIGTSGALALQWWTSTIDYPLNISGKPLFSYQAYVPVTFAVGVVFAAIAALIGMLALNGLPRYHHPVFFSKEFSRVTDDGFFISIEADDSKFDEKQTAEFLRSIGGLDVEVLHADTN
jgi:hypothetical protein